MRLKHFFLTVVFTFISLTLCAVQALALSVDNVRFGLHPDKTRMVLELSEVSDFRTFVLSDPYRIVVDLPEFDWGVGNITKPGGSGVSAIRRGVLKAGISRVVIDLSKPMTIRSAFILPAHKGKPTRLVIDFSDTTHAAFIEAKNNIHGTLSTEDLSRHTKKTASPPPVSVKQQPSTRTAATGMLTPRHKPTPAIPHKRPVIIPTIIIDPGHGGVDGGASSATGILEKHVVLAMAKQLKKNLEATGRYKVLLTRTKDKHMRLYKRVAFARKAKGDLFISLHADSIDKANVRGASIYTLSEKASDKQTARLAIRENRADIIAGVDLSVEDDDVADILIDLAMRDTMNQSNFFANTVVDKMKNTRIRILEKPHRSAGFAVLKAPDIPSVLIELGFMSNRQEAELLADPSYRAKIAASLAMGIDAYFNKIQHNNNI